MFQVNSIELQRTNVLNCTVGIELFLLTDLVLRSSEIWIDCFRTLRLRYPREHRVESVQIESILFLFKQLLQDANQDSLYLVSLQKLGWPF